MMRTRTMTRARLLLAVFLTGLFGTIALAQPTAARPDRGTPHVRAYSVSDLENISMTTGNVNLSIPLASLPPVAGGKLSFTLRAVYNSKLWDVTRSERRTPAIGYSTFMVDTPQLGNGGGWGIAAGYSIDIRDATSDVNYYRPQQHEDAFEWQRLRARLFRVVLTAPDGAEHELRPTDHANSYGGERPYLHNYYYDTPDTVNAAMRYHSFDGTYLYAVIEPLASAGDTRWTLFMPDGTRVIQYKNGIQRIRDTNNNSIKIYSTDEATYVQDEQTGREIKYVSDWANNLDRVSYRTVGGGSATVEIRWGWTRVQGKIYDVEDWNPQAGELGTGDLCRRQERLTDTDIRVIREIVLPATEPNSPGRKFAFNYDSDSTVTARNEFVTFSCGSLPATYERTASVGTGALSRMVTPSGAVVKYTYEYSSPLTSPHYYMEADEITRDHIASKSVTHDGVTDTWSYSIGVLGSSVSNPDGSFSSEVFYPLDPTWGMYFAQSAEKSGLVYRSINSGKTMVERHWTLMPFAGANTTPTGASAATSVNFNPVVDAEYTSLLEPDAGGQNVPVKMSAKTFRYDYNGNLLQTTEYDWFDPSLVQRDNRGVPTGVPTHDSVKVLRATINSYHDDAATADSPNVYAKRAWVTYAPVITNAVQETTLGASRSQYSYDGQAYGSPPTAGNVTRVSRFDDRGDADPANDQWVNLGFTYDTYGNKKTAADANGNVTEFFYEDATHAMPTKVVVDPLNGTGRQATLTAYDFWTGLVTSQTDANGHATNIDYTNQLTGAADPYGRPGVVASPAVEVNGVSQRRKVFTFYEDAARRVRVEADLRSEGDRLLKTRETRDQLDRPTLSERSEDGSANYTVSSRTDYEQMGRITFTSNPSRGDGASTDGWTRATKDASGRMVEVATFSGPTKPHPTNPANGIPGWTGSVLISYHANETAVTDQDNKSRKSAADALGRLTQVVEAPDSLNYQTAYTYDALGNLLRVVQGDQPPRIFNYSSLSRLASATNPESGTVTYTYDPNGNILTKTDARGVTTTYVYDGLNRAISRSYTAPAGLPSTPAVTYTYDTLPNRKGYLASVSSSVSTYNYTGYDAMGRVTASSQVTDGQTYTMSYGYDLAGNLISQVYPSGRIVNTTFDSAGRVSNLSGEKPGEATKTYASQFSYTPHGAEAGLKLGNSRPGDERWEHTVFNSRLQPTEVGLGTSVTDASILKLNYGYGTTANNGNVRSQRINVAGGPDLTQTYVYDEVNRLKSASEVNNATPCRTQGGTVTDCWKQGYTYLDSNNQNGQYGNRRIDATNTTANVMPQSNPAINPSNNRFSDSQGYDYDPAGNLTVTPGYAYAYDAENKQVSVNNGQALGLSIYSYDGNGRRVKKVTGSGGTTTVFVYNILGQLVAEYSNAVPPPGSGGTSYLTQDHLGSTRVVTGANGVVKLRLDYLPFGEDLGAVISERTKAQGYNQTDGPRQRYAGAERDTETGLDYMQARYFSSTQGRFTSTDPLYFQAAMTIDPQGFNLYAYVRNNPLRFTDPSGERLHLRGRAVEEVYEAVGGRETFDRYFEVKDGEVVLRQGADVSNANAGVQFIAELVARPENFLFYAGDNAAEAASYFRPGGTVTTEKIETAFNGAYMVSTQGRGGARPADLPNGERVFAAIAINTRNLFTQSDDLQANLAGAGTRTPFNQDVLTALMSGMGQKVKPVSLFIHEAAENLRFAQIGVHHPFFGRGRTGQFDNYNLGHNYSKEREARIRKELRITGGFAGGSLRRE